MPNIALYEAIFIKGEFRVKKEGEYKLKLKTSETNKLQKQTLTDTRIIHITVHLSLPLRRGEDSTFESETRSNDTPTNTQRSLTNTTTSVKHTSHTSQNKLTQIKTKQTTTIHTITMALINRLINGLTVLLLYYLIIPHC